MARLWRQAKISSGYAYWAEKDQWGSSPYEATAIALTAVMKVSPNDPRAVDIVRWLIANRQFNHWNSTRDTAIAIYALSDYVTRSKELSPDFSVTVNVNGKKVGNARFTGDMSKCHVMVNHGQPGMRVVVYRRTVRGNYSARKMVSEDTYPPMNVLICTQ